MAIVAPLLTEDRMVWIFGSSRSGSTWLLRMLRDHPGVVAFDEPHIGHHLGVWRPIALAWATADCEPELTTLLEVKRPRPDYFFSDAYRHHWEPALRDFIAARLEVQARDVARERGLAEPVAVIKEPGGSHVADLIMSLFPHAGLVFLLRDGRDVVDSWVDAYQQDTWAADAYPLADRGRLAFVRWQAAVWRFRTEVVQRAYEAHAPERRLLLQYEELKARPAPALAQVCTLAGLDSDPELIETIAERHCYESVPPEQKGSGREIRAARPGGWRENLSREEQDAMTEILGPKLDELGYAV